MSMTQEKMYMNVDDVCAVLGVSKAFAYKIMKGYNEELKERGFLVIPGKISTKFLAEKIYGMKVEEQQWEYIKKEKTGKFTEDETGRFYFERLDGYLDAIELDKDDREFIEDYLESLGLNESAKYPANRRLSLNEGINDMKMAVNVTKDTAKTIFNFINYSRELIKEAGLEPVNPKEERIFLQNDTLYYQISYMQINLHL